MRQLAEEKVGALQSLWWGTSWITLLASGQVGSDTRPARRIRTWKDLEVLL